MKKITQKTMITMVGLTFLIGTGLNHADHNDEDARELARQHLYYNYNPALYNPHRYDSYGVRPALYNPYNPYRFDSYGVRPDWYTFCRDSIGLYRCWEE